MGKKIKRNPKSFLQKEHEEDEEREVDLIQQEKSKPKSSLIPEDNSNIITNYEANNEKQLENEEEEGQDTESEIPSINLENELTEKLNSIKNDIQKFYDAKNKKIDFLEFPINVSQSEIPPNLNPDDDIKRELIFYNIAKENAIQGMIQLKKLGEKINRPDDYFVEMLKSDEQMVKVKKQIINEQQYIKKFINISIIIRVIFYMFFPIFNSLQRLSFKFTSFFILEIFHTFSEFYILHFLFFRLEFFYILLFIDYLLFNFNHLFITF